MLVTKSEMRSAFLQSLKNEKTGLSSCEIMREIADELCICDCELGMRLKYSGKPIFYTKFQRAKAFLLAKGFIAKADKGNLYSLTEAGMTYATALD